MAILDADKEGFLRSETSLIQTIGRAARNVGGQVVMYADQVTNSMQRAISETNRRRQMQMQYNQANGIDPKTIRKAVTDILSMIRPANSEVSLAKNKQNNLQSQSKHIRDNFEHLAEGQLERLIMTLEEEMNEAAGDLRFEYAARLRDEIREIKRDLKDMK